MAAAIQCDICKEYYTPHVSPVCDNTFSAFMTIGVIADGKRTEGRFPYASFDICPACLGMIFDFLGIPHCGTAEMKKSQRGRDLIRLAQEAEND